MSIFDKAKIKYDKFSERHGSTFKHEITEMKEKGIDFELNYKVAFTTWQEIRRARGMIMQSLLSDEAISQSFVKERTERRLSQAEIDRLCNLVTLAAMNCGVLFWTRDLNKRNELLKMHTTVLEKMTALTGEVRDPDSYSKFGNAQVMYTFNGFLVPYFEKGPPKTDVLGEHFPFGGSGHTFLDDISISKLKKQTEKGNTIVVLAAAASSGVLEAGIFAHYMTAVLGIPTTVDPTFFTNSYGKNELRVMSRVMPNQKTIVIPMDDRILGSGYSPRQSKLAATEKYGKQQLVMSPHMQKL